MRFLAIFLAALIVLCYAKFIPPIMRNAERLRENDPKIFPMEFPGNYPVKYCVFRAYRDKRLNKYPAVKRFLARELTKYENCYFEYYNVEPRAYFYDKDFLFISYLDIGGMDWTVMDNILFERGINFTEEYKHERHSKPYVGSFDIDEDHILKFPKYEDI